MNSIPLKSAIPLETQRVLLEKGNSYEGMQGIAGTAIESALATFKGKTIERENEIQTNSEAK